MYSQAEGKKLLKKVRADLRKSGFDTLSLKKETKLDIEDDVLIAVNTNKNILSQLYIDIFEDNSSSLSGKARKLILSRIVSLARNATERSLIKQQKYNENMTLLAKHLFEQNKMLEKRVHKLEKKLKDNS